MRNMFERWVKVVHQIKKNRGITLTELLVASILIGIIALGVMAFNVSLSQMESSSSRGSILAMQSVSILSSIRKDFNLITGDGIDWGLVMGSLSSGVNYVSFRQDLNNSPDPSRYDDDSWIIYIADINAHKLKRCVQSIVNPLTPKTFAVPNQSTTCSDANSSVLATNLIRADFYFDKDGSRWTNTSIPPVASDTKNQCVLNVTLASQYNTADPSTEPNKNPVFTLTTSIMPSAHSW